jgi:hypothetical protein
VALRFAPLDGSMPTVMRSSMSARPLAGLLLLVSGLACQSGRPSATPAPPTSVFDPLSYGAPSAPRLAFGLQDGPLRNYFFREGPAAVHLSTRSGSSPRIIAAFPANNQGIGVWFLPAPDGTELFAGKAADAFSAGGGLSALVRDGGAHPLHGVRATLKSSATRLSTALVLLGNVRTLRDYGSGMCLEDAAQFPELRNESFELDAEQGILRIRRQQIGGEHSMELLLAGLSGTTITLEPREAGPRPACPLGQGKAQQVITISNDAGIELQLMALASDEPLTPIEAPQLLDDPSDAESRDLQALAFSSYEEKLVAGSWRFLTYFGRDTLLSLWLLLPKLESHVAIAAMGSVLERVQLAENVAAPEGGVVQPGDVAHEEEVGDYAAWKNSRLTPPPADLRQPRYDYRMIDDDFLLAPLVVALAKQLETHPLEGSAKSTPAAAMAAFLARKRSDGHSYEEALFKNLALVLGRARPFAEDKRPAAEKKQALIALHPNLSVGQWRDSEMGLGFGRYPFDVNAALVPAALDAARIIYTRLGRSTEAADAKRLGAAWQKVEELFRLEIPLEQARANVASYAASVGVADTSPSITADASGNDVEYAIALDAELAPLPVQHSDHGFVLNFTRPPDAYLQHVAARLTRPFPAGLMSPVGVMVSNPAFAAPDFSVIDPKRRGDPNDDIRTPLRDLFTPAHYHGSVVWSWQQALLASGLRRQLLRKNLAPGTRGALQRAECELWRVIDATRAGSTRELWSWAPDADGHPALRPFGAGALDADESNAVQLWSTVYIAVRKPTPAQNPRCGATGAGP